ncbi:hypothetical protein B0T21DRAFT_363324 [Apiosordaria backusii]|uniref:Uncharacterized protein n=1 Tax=Apiosordaria backusii TaxID=314023 RepID=A0AA40BSV3_9PEZI|nr:hypothetical protein B0T21DRAFT_363324 [Apiosordaria backusii]
MYGIIIAMGWGIYMGAVHRFSYHSYCRRLEFGYAILYNLFHDSWNFWIHNTLQFVSSQLEFLDTHNTLQFDILVLVMVFFFLVSVKGSQESMRMDGWFQHTR